jgi:tetratricopeptide (TPR) repeat protein
VLRLVVRGALRLFRLPFDVLFLTFDYLRFTLWALLRSRAPLLASRLTRFGSPAAADSIEVSGRRVRRCGLARKYGSPELLRLLLPGIFPVRVQHGKAVWAWEQGSIQRPSTATRYITLGLGLTLVWGGLGSLACWVLTSRDVVRQSLNWLHPGSPGAAARQAATQQRAGTSGDTQKRVQAIGQTRAALDLVGMGKTEEARLAFNAAVSLDPTNLDAQAGLADCAYKLGLYPEAETALSRILQLNANSAPAHVMLARIAKVSGKANAAIEYAKRALSLGPESVEAMLLLSNCYLAAGQYDAAAEQAQAVVAIDPQNPGVSLALADVELARKSLIKAEKLYRKALDLDPGRIDAKAGLARILRLRGEYSAAVDVLNDLLAKAPDAADAILELAEVHVAQGKFDTGISMLRGLREKQPQFYQGRSRLAELLMYRGQTNAGYLVAQDLLKDDPGNFPAHVILADAFLQNGFPSLAIEHCRAALAQNAGRVMVIKLLTRACLAAGDYQSGAEEIRRVVEQHPSDLDANVMLAYCYEGMGRKDESIALLEAAANAFPSSAVPLSEMGSIYLCRGDQATAATYYERALTRTPEDPVVLNNLAALMLEGNGDKARAMELALEAARLLPGNPLAADTLGWAYCQRREFDKATEYLIFAALQTRQNPTVRYHLAEALYGKGEVTKARDQLKQALAMGQEFAAAPRATALLEKIRAELKESPAQETP